MEDTVNAYFNDKAIGRAIKKSYFSLNFKLWPKVCIKPNANDEKSEPHQADHVDLLFIYHLTEGYVSVYKGLGKSHKQKRIKANNISNFEVERLDNL